MNVPSLEGIEGNIEQKRQNHRLWYVARVFEGKLTIESEVPKNRSAKRDGRCDKRDQIHIFDDEVNGFAV